MTFRMLLLLAAIFSINNDCLASPILNVQDGKLLGASGVVIKDKSYDVSFVDGSCNSLFGGCNKSLFTFSSYQEANTAALALSTQVFIDSPLGNFDSQANLTNGCQDPAYCAILTPYDFHLQGSRNNDFVVFMTYSYNTLAMMEFRNDKLEASDYISNGGWVALDGIEKFNTSDAPHFVFSKWILTPPLTVEASEPMPSILLIIGLALLQSRKHFKSITKYLKGISEAA